MNYNVVFGGTLNLTQLQLPDELDFMNTIKMQNCKYDTHLSVGRNLGPK